MLAKTILATACLTLAAACATAPAPAVSAAGSVSKGTYYCWKERLAAEGDNLVCNWETSVGEACRSTGATTLKRSVAGEPRPAGMCTNGQWLVAVTPG